MAWPRRAVGVSVRRESLVGHRPAGGFLAAPPAV